MPIDVRPADTGDLPEMVALITEERKDLAARRPVYWRPSDTAQEMTNAFFDHLLGQASTRAFVATEGDQLLGFVIATDTAPPVFAPGGPSYLVDDWVVLPRPDRLAILEALFEAVEEAALAAGAAQVVCVAVLHDADKHEILARKGLDNVCTWATKPLS